MHAMTIITTKEHDLTFLDVNKCVFLIFKPHQDFQKEKKTLKPRTCTKSLTPSPKIEK